MTKNVWYRSTPGNVIEDRGTVTVEGGTLSFTGKKVSIAGRVTSAAKRSVGFKNWIKATYEANGETREAFFLIKDMLGWGGMLGGNRELLEALETAAQENSTGAAAPG
jgi:hypothetical protein